MSLIHAHLGRGLAVGAVGGLTFAAYTGLVGNHLVALAEAAEAAGGGGPGLAPSLGVVAAGAWGLLLGTVAFGVAYYFLEPVIPGRGVRRSYVTAAAGFVTVSGAPWLVLPPQPPGATAVLPTGTRQLLYLGFAAAGFVAVVASTAGYRRARSRGRAAALAAAVAPFVVLVGLGLAIPIPAPGGPTPAALAAAFRWSVVAGQVLLWLAMASAHAVLVPVDDGTTPDAPAIP